MKTFFQLLFIFCFCCFFGSCCNKLQFPQNGLTIGFYNVENLFDTIDDPHTDDKDFLPSGKNQWNTARYNHKINQLSRVIASMDSTSPPHIIGLAEIENKHVLNDLVATTELKSAAYDIVHFDSKDPRGIEVALLYQPKYFKLLTEKEMKVKMNAHSGEMRFVLYVKGIVAKEDTLHIFVNHWKSRSGGAKETEPKRIRYADFLREKADSLFRIDPNANIVICGDLNDNPTDISIVEHLKALPANRTIEAQNLYNLSFIPFSEGAGTLYYQNWDFFDQIIVSSNLLKKQAKSLCSSEITTIRHPWMLYTYKGKNRPNRTFSGGKYYGGFSDHLPVMIRLAYE
ncbi:MAG: hypothetical protein LBM67_05995 [Lentimicrobiaceae bacterium]|jgi:predicted extracellular nuclease|nr:hypothetical protein [Lentimicrobiaceae bacterium]